ncbi:MAG: hemolysin family protein [Chloroflexi bacterium]|nr:hemolysin family protein [Chloroflexota bacterium]
MSSLFEIFIIFVLLLLNGLFAMAEIAIVSARKARLQQAADEGSTAAQAALKAAQDPNNFLATTQIGITLVGIFAGAYGGANLTDNLANFLNTIPLIDPYGQTVAFISVVVAVTYFSLIIGELVPKRLGLNNAERIAMLVAPPMAILSWLTSPVVWFLTFSTNLVLRLLRVQPSDEPEVTEEEIKVMIEQGRQIGIFEDVEQEMIEGVLRLDDRRVSMVMTPRPQIEWLDINDSLAAITQTVLDTRLSRFPVANGDLDDILGIVYAKDLLAQILTQQEIELATLVRPPLYIPEGISVLQALEIFKREQTHIALVFDEYGGIEGLITADDILGTIVGDMASETNNTLPIVERDDGSWLVDGLLPVDDFREALGFTSLPDEAESRYQTVGGMMLHMLGGIPKVGQSFVWQTWRFEVMDMDGRRVDKILVSTTPET